MIFLLFRMGINFQSFLASIVSQVNSMEEPALLKRFSENKVVGVLEYWQQLK